jgi:serine/threonine protein kinase
VVGVYRDAAPDQDHHVRRTLRELSKERLVERITVRPLTPEGTSAMVTSIVGAMETSEEFAAFVHRRTRGFPLFIAEMLRSLGGRYRLVREIGAGGMGRVFHAVDMSTGESVAAKIMFTTREAEEDATLRFEREGAVLAQLQHPNIVRVHGTFMEEHASCIIMELLERGTLGDALRQGPVEPARVKTIMLQVAAALIAAHDKGIVHRDIKPANILMMDEEHVKVTDFGIARVLRPAGTLQSITSTGMTLGTPLYMSPEQIEGRKVDGRSDIYSLGAVFYQLVTGRPPFDSPDALSVAVQHLTGKRSRRTGRSRCKSRWPSRSRPCRLGGCAGTVLRA